MYIKKKINLKKVLVKKGDNNKVVQYLITNRDATLWFATWISLSFPGHSMTLSFSSLVTEKGYSHHRGECEACKKLV